MKLTLKLILILALSIRGFGQEQTHQHLEGRFKITVNNKWIVTKEKAALVLKQKLKPESFQVLFNFFEGKNIEEAYETYITKSFPEAFKDYEVIEERREKINGDDFRLILFNSRDKGIEFQNLIYMTKNKDFIYTFIGTSTPSRMNKFQAEFENMVESIEYFTIELKPVVADEILSALNGRTWLLAIEQDDFAAFPVLPESALKFRIEGDRILQMKGDNDKGCDNRFEYDNASHTIVFSCKGRSLRRTIVSNSGEQLKTDEIDDFGESVKRTWKAID